jgi:hypothetical protein
MAIPVRNISYFLVWLLGPVFYCTLGIAEEPAPTEQVADHDSPVDIVKDDPSQNSEPGCDCQGGDCCEPCSECREFTNDLREALICHLKCCGESEPPCHCLKYKVFDFLGSNDLYYCDTYEAEEEGCEQTTWSEYWYGTPSPPSPPQLCDQSQCEAHIGGESPVITTLKKERPDFADEQTVELPPHNLALSRYGGDGTYAAAPYLMPQMVTCEIIPDNAEPIYFRFNGFAVGIRREVAVMGVRVMIPVGDRKSKPVFICVEIRHDDNIPEWLVEPHDDDGQQDDSRRPVRGNQITVLVEDPHHDHAYEEAIVWLQRPRNKPQ